MKEEAVVVVVVVVVVGGIVMGIDGWKEKRDEEEEGACHGVGLVDF